MRTILQGIILLCFFIPTRNSAQEIGAEYPGSYPLLLAGVLSHNEGKYEEAISMYDSIPNGDTLFTLALYEKALSLQADSQFTAALTALDELAMYPNAIGIELPLLKAGVLDYTGRTDEADALYTELTHSFGYSNRPWFERSIISTHKGDYAQSLKFLEQSLRLNPYHSGTHFNIGILAAEADQPALAIMALFYASLTSTDGADDIRDKLVTLETVGNDTYTKGHKPVPDGTFDFCSDLTSINEVVKSRVALNAKYKSKIKANYTYMKQVQVICEMLDKQAVSEHPILAFYTSFFKEMWSKGLYAGMIIEPMTEMNIPEGKKLETKYGKLNKEFLNANANFLEEHSSQVAFELEGKEVTQQILFKDSKIVATGQMKNRTDPTGEWIFFHPNGTISARGQLEAGGKEGVWKNYDENGSLRQEMGFADGVQSGEVRNYSISGCPTDEFNVSNNQIEGPVKIYHPGGLLQSEYTIKNNEKTGPETEYDSQGFKESETTYVTGKGPVHIRYFNRNGSVSFEAEFTDGEYNGPAVFTGESGSPTAEGPLLHNKRNGSWKNYFTNGVIESEGDYANGKRNGTWKIYNSLGQLTDTKAFKNDVLDGASKEYDREGRLLSEVTYRSGRGINYAYYDETGKVIQDARSTGGKLQVQTFNYLRHPQSQGTVDHDAFEGDWKFYRLNGSISSECTYHDGELDGNDISYYPSGIHSDETYYKEGVAQGYYRKFNQQGVLTEEGYYLDGQYHGPKRNYYPDGTLSHSAFYWKGERNGISQDYQHSGEKSTAVLYSFGVPMKVFSYDDTNNITYTCVLTAGTGTYEVRHRNGVSAFRVNMVSGNFEGTAEWNAPDGSSEGTSVFIHGLRHGFSFYMRNGVKTSEGPYYYNDQHGQWNYYNDEGKTIKVVDYVEGSVYGHFLLYHDNGKLYQDRSYYNDEKDSTIVSMAEDGTTMAALDYCEGVLLSYSYPGADGKLKPRIPITNDSGKVTTYFANGKKSIEFELVNGQYTGMMYNYHPNGKVREEIPFRNDDYVGTKKSFYANGQLKESVEWMNDEEHGARTTYYENGKVKSEENFVMGEKHGPAKYYDKNGKIIRQGDYYYDAFYAKGK